MLAGILAVVWALTWGAHPTITCRDVVKDANGEVVELRCTYDPATRGGNAPDGRKVKATMHRLPAAQSVPAVRAGCP